MIKNSGSKNRKIGSYDIMHTGKDFKCIKCHKYFPCSYRTGNLSTRIINIILEKQKSKLNAH